MTKKSYVAYSISLILCLVLGVAWVVLILFGIDIPSYLMEFIGGILCTFPFAIAAILSFFFTKKTLLSMGKKAFLHILLWNVVVFALSTVSISLCLGDSIVRLSGLLFSALFYTVPCVLSSVASIVIYSHKIHCEETPDTPSRKHAILSQFSLFFVPASLLVLYEVVQTPLCNGNASMLFAGVQTPFLLAVTFASCVYARKATQRLRKFPLENLIINFVFSALSSALLFLYAKAIAGNDDFFSILSTEFGWAFTIVIALLPPICFSISAAISVACNKRKARKQDASVMCENEA